MEWAVQMPSSRRGEGRAALRLMLRECAISEAMSALRIYVLPIH
jgi:uncharacterized protein YdiU (UPF0061 family)